VIAIQYNYHYSGIVGVINLIRNFSPKPLWAVDAASCTLLGRHQSIAAEYDRNRYPHLTEKEIADILWDASSSRHKEIASWWEAERARTSFKKIIHAAALGLDHIFLQFVFDQTSPPKNGDTIDINPWNFSGLLEKNGDSRPVVYAIRIFHDTFRGFSEVEDLSRRQGPSEEWIMHYRFKVRRKSIDVVWTDGHKQSYKMGPPGQHRRITRVIETAISRTPSIESLPGGLLEIGTNPIIVETEG
jgi:hypothetical protein